MARIVNKAGLAEFLGVSLSTIDGLLRQGIPTVQRGSKGAEYQFDTADVVRWRVESAVKDAAGLRDSVDLDEARRRKLAAEAALAELDLSIRRGDAVSLNDTAAAWEGMAVAFRNKMLGLPAKLAPVLVAETDLATARGTLEREVHEALEELSSYEPVRDIRRGAGSAAGSDQGGSGDGEAAAAVNGEPVGGSVPAAKPRKQRRARPVADG